MGLEGWATEYCMPMADDAATTDADESVVCTGDDATFTAMTDADGDPALTDADGKGTLSFTADVDNLPAMVYVQAADNQSDKLDYGEEYEQTDALMHSHDGLILPADNDPSMNTDELDKGSDLHHLHDPVHLRRRPPRTRRQDGTHGLHPGSEKGTRVQADTRKVRSKSG